MDTPFTFKNKYFEIFFWLFLSFVLVLSIGGFYVQFYSNQNLHLLRGLAFGRFDGLSNDWLANTKDPMPVFNFFVQITSKYFGASVFYLIQIILIAVYLFSIIGITDHLFHIKRSKLLFISFLVISLFSHSAFLYKIIKIDIYSGLAGQAIGFNQFLPNIFASFLFLSIFLFLKKKYFIAVISLCLAGYIHSGYVTSAAVLTASFMIITFLESKDIKTSLKIGSLALVIMIPLIIFTLQENAGATSNQVFEAVRIMVEERIPHHTQVNVWWNTTAVIKLLICILALWISRKSKIFPIVLIGFLVTFLPVLLLTIRPSNKIAILQFWRVSVLLVPLSTTIILGYLISTSYSSFGDFFEKKQKIFYLLLGGLVVLFTVTGIKTQIDRIEFYRNNSANQLYGYIRENTSIDSTYLIPPEDYDLQGFRLETETPIFVDWKNHPWNTIEFLEWYDRFLLARSFYKPNNEQACSTLFNLVQDFQITHLVTYTDQPPKCSNLTIQYQDSKYSLYSIDESPQ